MFAWSCSWPVKTPYHIGSSMDGVLAYLWFEMKYSRFALCITCRRPGINLSPRSLGSFYGEGYLRTEFWVLWGLSLLWGFFSEKP